MDDDRIFDDNEVVDFLLCEESLKQSRHPPGNPQGCSCLGLLVLLLAPAGLVLSRFLA